MTQEEKARAYDEALEKAKIEINTKGIGEAVNLCYQLFPELAESEDERIINQLITLVNSAGEVLLIPTNKEELVAWLNKCKESLHTQETCKENADSFTDEDERIRKELKEAFEAYDIESTWNGIPIRSIFAWLEKQTKSERVIKAARRVLNIWLDGTDCPDVPGDFTELEYAIREYDGDEKLKEQNQVESEGPHYTKRNALFDKCVENCDPDVMKKVSNEVDEMLQKEHEPIGTDFRAAVKNLMNLHKIKNEFTEEDYDFHAKELLELVEQKEQKPLTDEEKEYIRTIKSIISDFIRDKKPENLAYYQRIYDWLDGRHVPFSCGHENGKSTEWAELQSEFRNINEAFEDGKKEVIDHPDKYGLTKQKPVDFPTTDEEVLI